MSKSVSATVQGIRWITTQTGIVRPLAVLDKMYKRGEVEFDSLGLENAGAVDKFGLEEGVKVKIAVNKKDKSLKITSSDGNKNVSSFPGGCPTCGSELVNIGNTNLACTGDICPAKSRTPIVKLIRAALKEEVSAGDVYQYTNTFPLKKDGIKIGANSIISFLEYFKEAGSKDTNARDVILKNTYGEFYERASEIEKAVYEKLKNGFTSEEFWYVATIKGIRPDDTKHLKTINFSPVAMLSFEEQVARLDIDKDLKFNVVLNKEYLYTLRNKLSSF